MLDMIEKMVLFGGLEFSELNSDWQTAASHQHPSSTFYVGRYLEEQSVIDGI